MSVGTARSWFIALVLLLTLGALALRWRGLDSRLPYDREPDAYLVKQAELITEEEQAQSPKVATKYPLLLPTLLTALSGAGAGANASAPGEPIPGESFDEQLLRAARPFRQGRALVAVLAVLCVPLTAFLARRWLSRGASWLAAALLATSLLHVLASTQARPHAAHATFVLAALAALLLLRDSPTKRRGLLAGVALALAAGSLQTGAFLLAPLAVGYATRSRPGPRAPWIVAALVLVASVPVFYPREGYTPGEHRGLAFLNVANLENGLRSWNGEGFSLMPSLFWRSDPALFLGALLGLPFALAAVRRSQRGDALVVSSFALPYALAIGTFDLAQSRYLLPLLPLLAIVAAGGVGQIARRLHAPWTVGLMGAALLAVPVWANASVWVLDGRPDTLRQASDWLTRHYPVGAERRPVGLLMPGLTLPLPLTPEAALRAGSAGGAFPAPGIPWSGDDGWDLLVLVREDSAGQRAKHRLPTEVAEIRALLDEFGAEFVLLCLTQHDATAGMVEGVRAITRPGASFPATDGDGTLDSASGYQDPDLLQRVLHGVAWGPPLELRLL